MPSLSTQAVVDAALDSRETRLSVPQGGSPPRSRVRTLKIRGNSPKRRWGAISTPSQGSPIELKIGTQTPPAMSNTGRNRFLKICNFGPMGPRGQGQSDLVLTCNLTRAEHSWLKDCQYYYQDVKQIDLLEMLHDVRERMVTEGPRWWKDESGVLHWMPRRFWGANRR